MSSGIKVFRKSFREKRRLFIDYACFLDEMVTLVSFQVLISALTDPPLIVTTSFPDVAHKRLMMFVSGGKEGTDYTITLLVTTSAGQVKQDVIGMRVTP